MVPKEVRVLSKTKLNKNHSKVFKWERFKIWFMFQKIPITFHKENELQTTKEKYEDYCSTQVQDEKGLDQDKGRNGEKGTDSKCILEGDTRLTHESDVMGDQE